ncbi:hypothetical protein [Kitasatospora purpeofusca]|uniref:hypothetical protein n=1 Tax=Kitasatospora purpeofusca TaxID=67352 RepID=UPI00381F965B
MSEPTPAEQPDADVTERARRALGNLSDLMASPPCPPDLAPAGPRRTVARLLGHLDQAATTRTCAKQEDDQP